MPIGYDHATGGFQIISDECEDCGEPLYFSGCDAPGCTGFCCMDCGTGCDLDTLGDEGNCARATAEEDGGDRDERINAERAAFGLSPAGTSAASRIGPWHDVEIVSYLYGSLSYRVGHPAECGWTEKNPGVCPFEDVLDDEVNDEYIPGEFRARVIKGYYDPVTANHVEDTLEWQAAGGESQ